MNKVYAITCFTLLCLISSLVHGQVDLLVTAETHIQQSNFYDALNVLNTHIEHNPNDAKAYLKRGSVYAILGQKQKQQEDLRQAQNLNPDVLMFVDASLRSQNYAKNKYAYDVNNNVDRTFIKSPVREKYYIKYIDNYVQDDLSKMQLLDIIYFLSIKDTDAAEAQLRLMDSADHANGIIHDIRGLIELSKGRVGESIAHFTNAITAMPNLPLAYHNRAIAYTLMDKYDLAIQDLEEAIELDNNISLFYFSKALLDEYLGSYRDAKENYEQALNRNPHYVEAHTNHSLVMKSLGAYENSTIQLLNILHAYENSPKSNFIKGGIHLTFGEYEEAIDAFDKYLIKNDQDPAALFNRGLAKILSGDSSEGCYDLSLSIDKNDNSKNQNIYNSFCSNW